MRAISEVHQEPSLAAKILHHRASYQLLVLTLAIGCALIFTFASYRVGIFYGQDIPAHLSWAKQLAEQGVTYLPHFTYQQMVVIVRALLPFSAAELIQKGLSAWLAERSYKIAGLLVLAIFYGLTAILIQRRLYSTLQTIKSKHSGALSILFTLVLMLVAPINLLTISQHRLYLGYIGINVYHNPTVIMLKPMALVIFWLILGWIWVGLPYRLFHFHQAKFHYLPITGSVHVAYLPTLEKTATQAQCTIDGIHPASNRCAWLPVLVCVS
jgi:hypothetical protein